MKGHREMNQVGDDNQTEVGGVSRQQEGSKAKAKGEIVPAEVVRVMDLVSYQEGSVVSRILVRRDTGNVTLFAFSDGQELSEHTAPFDALVEVLEGEVEIMIAGKPFQLGAGEVILMPANQTHALRAITRLKMLLIMNRS